MNSQNNGKDRMRQKEDEKDSIINVEFKHIADTKKAKKTCDIYLKGCNVKEMII